MSHLAEKLARLSPKEREKLKRYLQEKKTVQAQPKIARQSFAQERLWFLDQLEGPSDTYNASMALRLMGEIQLPILKKSFAQILQRHESLRTTFGLQGEEPVQLVHPQIPLPFTEVNLTHLPDELRESEVMQRAAEIAKEPFDLNTGPLVKITLMKLEADVHLLLVTMHHIITDGWSMGIVIRELTAIYQSLLADAHDQVELPKLPLQYADYAAWQRNWLSGATLEENIRFWKEVLAGAPPLLELPLDHHRPEVQTYRGADYYARFDGEMTEKVKALAKECKSTLYVVLLTAFSLLLHRYTGQDDVVVGSPSANRNRREIENLIGFFINMLPIRVNFSENLPFRELVQRVQQQVVAMQPYQDTPLSKIVDELQVERNLNYSPIFQVMFSMQNVPEQKLHLPGLEIQPVKVESPVAKYDLSLVVEEMDGGLKTTFKYNTDLFAEPTVARMAGHLRQLVSGIVTNPEALVSELEYLSVREREQILREFNLPVDEMAKGYSGDLSISGLGVKASKVEVSAPSSKPISGPSLQLVHRIFEKQVEVTPEATAVVAGTEQLTYRELNEQANQLAHLLRKEGVQPNQPVAMLLTRGPRVLVGILGILKAGGAYVPLDPDYPTERIRYILQHSGARILVTEGELATKVAELVESGIQVVVDLSDEEQMADLAQESVENLVLALEMEGDRGFAVNGDDLMYVIYTSGSTGKPKGVMVRHRNAANYLWWSSQKFAINEQDRTMLITSVSFDISVYEIFGALLNGAELHIISKEHLHDPQLLYGYMAEKEITIWHSVPTLMTQLLMDLRYQGIENTTSLLPKLRQIMLGGESWSVELAKEIRTTFPKAKLTNMYGPTEATIWVTYYDLGDEINQMKLFPIGKAIANNQVLILDRYHQLCGIGIPGDIYVTGANVTKGYYRDEAKTREVFVQKDGQILYRTGDLGKYLPNGEILFMGRKDGMVKVRGYRIEVGEIENVLLGHAQVREVAVIVKQDGSTGRLICYFTAETNLVVSELTDFLRQTLPDYMIPARFVQLAKMPLTPNGKIDRRALPEPELTIQTGVEYLPPRTELEETLAEIWREILKLERVGVLDHFFTLGGDSIKSIQVVNRCQKYKIPLTSFDLFKYPTIARLAEQVLMRTGEWVKGDQGAGDMGAGQGPEEIPLLDADLLGEDLVAAEKLVAADPNIEAIYPVTPMQRVVLNYNLMNAGTAYSISISSFLIQENIYLPAFMAAWREVMHRHPILRTAFRWRRVKTPVQIVYRSLEVPFRVEDWRGISCQEQREKLELWVKEEQGKSFKVGSAPLMRGGLARLSDDCYQMIWSYQNSLFDGWSSNIILNELFQSYQELATSTKKPTEITYPFYPYVKWLAGQDIEAAKSFWVNELTAYQPLTRVEEVDQDRVEVASSQISGLQGIELTPATVERLKDILQAEGLTLNTFLMGCWALLLSQELGDDLLVGTITSGRPAQLPAIEKTAGLFINTLPVRVQVDRSQNMLEWFQALQEKLFTLRQYEYVTLQQIAQWSEIPIDHLQGVVNERTLVYLNFPVEAEVTREQNRIARDTENRFGSLNIPFRVYVNPDGNFRISIRFNAGEVAVEQVSEYLRGFESLIRDLTVGVSTQMSLADLLKGIRD